MKCPPKLVPPLNLSCCLWLIIIPRLVLTLPTVPHSLQGNVIQNIDKSLFQPPALEETIHEVQMILNRDPSLPRLTRGEIEELYEKVTKEEYQKSMAAGDKVRADSMRALMLVLPYNTDNNTEENLQELFTRPPVTKVVDSYTSHFPIQFLTPSLHNEGVRSETKGVGQMDATTYKPLYHLNTKPLAPNPTTYHPSHPPPVLYRMTPSINEGNFVPFTPLRTDLPINYDYNSDRSKNPKPVQRFSSHYNAKNAEFLKVGTDKKKSSATIKPVADVLESLGIKSGYTQTRSRVGIEDYYAAESAPKPQIVSVADLKGLRTQSLGPQIKPDAYSMFKPLNIGEEIRAKPEVEGYLTRFGIVGGRKRKTFKKSESSSTQNSLEQLSQESEIATAKIPASHVKAKKGVPTLGNSELEKLLENLRELERLNVNTKTITTTAKPSTTSTTTTTTTTTPAPSTSASTLITNGAPMLIEPKKPRRRIDPNIDINFANKGNQQTDTTQDDQLSKLLENLQELEKLKINPENVLKNGVSSLNQGSSGSASRPIAIETPAPLTNSGLTNRFTMANLTPQQQLLLFQQQAQSGSNPPDLDQLQRVLQQLQIYEKANAKTTTTTSTTKKPLNVPGGLVGPADLWQLRKLLTDDNELEKLFEQAKAKQQQSQKPQAATTSTSTTTSTTTKKPGPSVNDLIQLQKYLADLEKATSKATTTPRTTTSTLTTSTTTTSTTTTTTPKPTVISIYPETRPKKQTVDQNDLQALINRVQQLERLNIAQRVKELEKPLATDTPLSPFMGFTTRNVKASTIAQQQDLRLPVNDFANLRTLYRQVEEAEKVSPSDIEISTKATAVKAYQEQQFETSTRKSQNFAQRIIDITNDTGSGSSLQEVDANDFVQLQKLLSKVQELDRVRINVPTPNPKIKYETDITKAPNLDAAASQRNHNVQNINGAHIVYPSKEPTSYREVEQLLLKEADREELKLNLPAYKHTIEKPKLSSSQTSSEELKDLVYDKTSMENEAYKNLQPAMIHKTVTKEPPRFVATKSPKELKTQPKQKMTDLEELQKLLNNAQELKKLGVSLPQDLTEQLETKFTQTSDGYTSFKKLPDADEKTPVVDEYLKRFGLANSETVGVTTTFTPTTAASEEEEPSERTAVFSLTTMKSLIPKPVKTTPASLVDVPIFSATKIIEAAIKRAANRIGVSTENPHGGPQGFRRRTDDDVQESADEMEIGISADQDLMADFSEFNYQLAMPEENKDLKADFSEMNYELASPVYKPSEESKPITPVTDLTENVDELQRLIKNLQELKNLNLTPDDKALLRQADLQYLENLKKQQTPNDNTIKNRRQSLTPTEATTSDAQTTTTTSTEAPDITSTTTTTNANRIQLNLNLDDDDLDVNGSSDTDKTSTEKSSTTSTTEESRNGSLADLEDSFGPDPNTESPPPPKKKNGFYFLADWNSFLEVGDGDDQVVVRLSPKIGDPRLFLPVKIP